MRFRRSGPKKNAFIAVLMGCALLGACSPAGDEQLRDGSAPDSNDDHVAGTDSGAGEERDENSTPVVQTTVELGPERVSLGREGGCWINSEGDAECWDADDEWSQQGDFVQTSSGTTRWGLELRREAMPGWGTNGAAVLNREDAEFVQIDVARVNDSRCRADLPYVCGIRLDGIAECWGPWLRSWGRA
ncbi:hypothetical protein [Candidatus Poriferisodalis sp.]|uniref:hypothetical protein n=1 Tax=Candidatus Poriferisodalis sp. TaxID=3101277 RepID=UPI003B017F69